MSYFSCKSTKTKKLLQSAGDKIQIIQISCNFQDSIKLNRQIETHIKINKGGPQPWYGYYMVTHKCVHTLGAIVVI